MPEDIEKTLELAQPSAPEPPTEPTTSTSASFSRVCGFLALGSVILFWMLLGAAWSGHNAHGGDPDAILFLIAGEGLLLAGLSLPAIICAIVGFTGAERHPGNAMAAGLAIVLTLLSVAGFLAPIIIYLSQGFNYW